MSLADVLSTIRSLSRAERLHLVQLIAADLEQEERLSELMDGQACPIWSPLDATEAATIMFQALNEDRERVSR